jgi:ABC-2 type transport system permease protein
MFARKRTYIGFGAYLALEILVVLLFQIPKVQRGFRGTIERFGGVGDAYFSGLTLALIMVMVTFILTMLYVALVGGDVVAKEVEDGTMRMTLCRPVSRIRLLALKYCACVIYTFALIFFIGISALIVGLLRYGTGGLFVMALEQRIIALYDFTEGLARYGGALFLYSLSFLSITTLAFMFSCFNMKPAAATIISLSFFVVDFILYHLPYFSEIKGWFITNNMDSWTNIFIGRIPWTTIVSDYTYLMAMNATFVVIAAARFQQRDFKS